MTYLLGQPIMRAYLGEHPVAKGLWRAVADLACHRHLVPGLLCRLSKLKVSNLQGRPTCWQHTDSEPTS